MTNQYTKKTINKILYVIECKLCKKWSASASEYYMLSEFSSCDCDEKNINEDGEN